jgi:hypothetical protein
VKRDEFHEETAREYAERVLSRAWDCTYWTRDDQVNAIAEGWHLSMGRGYLGAEQHRDRIGASYSQHDFRTTEEAIEHVLARAEQGSELHCRAIALHVASVLKYGKQV